MTHLNATTIKVFLFQRLPIGNKPLQTRLDFAIEETTVVIELVWDRESSSYKNFEVQDLGWVLVSGSLGSSPTSIKTLYTGPPETALSYIRCGSFYVDRQITIDNSGPMTL